MDIEELCSDEFLNSKATTTAAPTMAVGRGMPVGRGRGGPPGVGPPGIGRGRGVPPVARGRGGPMLPSARPGLPAASPRPPINEEPAAE
jgi:hypothetical protein